METHVQYQKKKKKTAKRKKWQMRRERQGEGENCEFKREHKNTRSESSHFKKKNAVTLIQRIHY